MDWIQNRLLVGEQEWIAHIANLEQASTPSTKEAVKQALVNAIVSRIPKQRFGVFLSGGVDSSFIAMICKQQHADFICYSVGLEGADDLKEAQNAAKLLDLTLKTKTFTMQEAEALFKRTASIFETPDALNVGVGSVVVAAAELAKQDNINILFGGLGSEEIFAGYERHVKATDKHAECWRGLKAMWQRDFQRDYALAKALNIAVLTPFLDEQLIKNAMGIPAEQKINQEHKKIILREIAEELGLPKSIAWRAKKAAQYGSKFDWAMEKLAKQKGLTKIAFVQSLNK